MPHIVHISSVHNSNDPRIRRKQLGAIVDEGWLATFVTGDMAALDDQKIHIVKVSPGRLNRLRRLLLTSPLAVHRAFKMNADIYHLHDPELLPWAWVLILKRKPIVYDIHEDYLTSIRQKYYLPRWLRGAVAHTACGLEQGMSRFFYRVIAEKYYERRFPDALPIMNYPPSGLLELGIAFNAESEAALYTGNVTTDRGALQLARLVRKWPEAKVAAIGYCSPATAASMREEAGDSAHRLELVGEGEYVPFDRICSEYRKRQWLAGLALFPDTEHYREKELTKFFEYMAVGLPIVASNFPAWRRLIEGQGVGLCVDVNDPEAAAAALTWLRQHPREAGKMAERGRHLVRSVYNWEREGRKLIDFYRDLMKDGRRTEAAASR